MSHDSPVLQAAHAPGEEPPRRVFLSAAGLTMAGGLAAAYGTFGAMLGQFAYPAAAANRAWLFVCSIEQLTVGQSLDFTAPNGAKIVVARQAEGNEASAFLALSSVCPHLGCRVFWEAANDRFFCPCHNGVFDRSGGPVSGPPKAAHQSLVRFPLRVENGLLFVEAPVEQLVSAETRPSQTPPSECTPAERLAPAEALAHAENPPATEGVA